jgi:hypothetical protein
VARVALGEDDFEAAHPPYVSILSMLLFLSILSYQNTPVYGKKLKMLKALTFGSFDSLLSILIPLGARA